MKKKTAKMSRVKQMKGKTEPRASITLAKGEEEEEEGCAQESDMNAVPRRSSQTARVAVREKGKGKAYSELQK